MEKQHESQSIDTRTAGTISRTSALRMLLPAAVVFSVAPPAHAYLDPGTGSIILQGIVAGVAATVAYAGMYWERVKAFFTGRSRSAGDESAESGTKPGEPSA